MIQRHLVAPMRTPYESCWQVNRENKDGWLIAISIPVQQTAIAVKSNILKRMNLD
jgi:hypothetical protein